MTILSDTRLPLRYLTPVMKRTTAILLFATALPASADLISLMLTSTYGIFTVTNKFMTPYKPLMSASVEFPRGMVPKHNESELAKIQKRRHPSLFSRTSDPCQLQTTGLLNGFPKKPSNMPRPTVVLPPIVEAHVDSTAIRMGLFIERHLSHVIKKAGLPPNTSGAEFFEFLNKLEIERPLDRVNLQRATLFLNRDMSELHSSRQHLDNFFSALSDLAMIVHRYASPTDAPLFVRPIPMDSLIPDHRDADFITFVPTEEELYKVAESIPHRDRDAMIDILQRKLPSFDFEKPSREDLVNVSLERIFIATLIVMSSHADSPTIQAKADSIIALKKAAGNATGDPGDFFSPEVEDFDLLIFDENLP